MKNTKTLLRIDASSRIKGSHSRVLADFIECNWLKNNPGGNVVNRDLVKENIPHIHNDTIEGFYCDSDEMSLKAVQATALSDKLINELKMADEVLVSSPLYNLNIPSNLKAYIDQITRVRHTIRMKPDGSFQGLLKNKSVYLALVKGGSYANTPMEKFDFQTLYLQTIFEYIGLKVEATFSLEGTADKTVLCDNLKKVMNEVESVFHKSKHISIPYSS